MALSDVKDIFGVHSYAPYRRADRTFYGILRALGDSTLNFTGELIQLNGGSNKFPWAIEEGLITAEINLVFREYPSFVFELFAGATVVTNAAETTGSVSTITNVSGTSVQDATTGIASVAVTASDEADLKFGKVTVVAASATTVDIFYSTNIDFKRGTDVVYADDDLQVGSSVTIPGTGGTVAIADLGLEFTGGSGSIALVTGESATFDVRPINTKSRVISVGSSASSFPEHGAVVMAKKGSDGALFEIDLFRVKAAGLPIGLTENAFSEATVAAQAFYDSAKDGVFELREAIAP